jgi:hypothetical protein
MTTVSEYKLSPYPQYLWVVFTDDHEQAAEKITRKIRRTNPDAGHFKEVYRTLPENPLAFVSGWNNVHVAYFNASPEKYDNDSIFIEKTRAYIFSHEAVHVMSKVFSRCGIQYDPENDEPAAYLLSNIVSCMYTEWEDVKEKFTNTNQQ